MQTRIVAIMMICFVALSGVTAVSGGVSYTSLDSMNENNVTEVSVNATPTVSNSKQRRQYRLAYVSWKNRIADLRMSAIFKWLRTEYYPSLVSIADAASSGSSGVSFARDSMTIQDAWWDLDETMDMDLHRDSVDDKLTVEELYRILKANKDLLIVANFFTSPRYSKCKPTEIHDVDIVAINGPSVQLNIGWFFESARDSNDLEGNYDETCCGFIYNQFKDFNVDDLNYCICCGSEFVLPDARDSFNDALEYLEAACKALKRSNELGHLSDINYEQMNGKIAYLEEDVRKARKADIDENIEWLKNTFSPRDSMQIKDVYFTNYVNETNPKIEITKDSRVFSYHLSDGEGMFDTYKEFRAWCVEDVIERDGMYCFDITAIARDSQTTMQIVVGCPSGSTVDFTRIFTVNADGDEEDMCYLVSEIQDLIEARVSAWNNPKVSANTATLPSVARDSIEEETTATTFYRKVVEILDNGRDEVNWSPLKINVALYHLTLEYDGCFDVSEDEIVENLRARDSKQLLKDMPRLPVLSRLEILEMAREIHMVDGNGIAYENNATYFNVRLPINRFNFFKQLDIIADWACGEYGYQNGNVDSEINSWRMPSFEDNGIDDRERRSSMVITISRRGLEVATALHQMNVAQEVLDGARDSKKMKYTHYVQNEDHLGIDVIEGNTKDELIADLFAHIAAASGYHEISKKEAVKSVIEDELESHQVPECLNKDIDDALVKLHRNIRLAKNDLDIPRDSADSDTHTIDLTPSPKGYARMLKVVIQDSPIAADVEWATAELEAWEKAHPEIVARDSAWDDEKLSYAIELLSEKDFVKYQEWVDSQDGDWNDDGTISFVNANAMIDFTMRELRREKLQSDMGYCRETELLLCNLERHGFTLVGHRPYGDHLIKFNRTVDDEGNMPSNHYDIQNIIYTCWNHEDTTLIVNHLSRGDREIGIRLVYGNEFGVLAADYSCPRDYDSKPEWYTALKSACNTDIDSIEEYEAITGSSMEYNIDEGGNMSGKISFSDMNELGYKYELCPKCLETGHENNSPYCQRYGASLSNGDTGSCIGYPSEEIARDSVERVLRDDGTHVLPTHRDHPINKLNQIEMMKRIKIEHFYDLEHLAKITNERLENARLHLGSIVKRIDELGGYIDDEDRRFLDDEARDSAEMAVLIPSRFDENVSARELHPNVNSLNPDGFKWSDEQVAILNDFAWWFEEYQNGTKTSRPRMVIESVAGSGKTTLVKELLSIINRFDSATKTIASAFNVHIAKILKDEIKDQQKNGFRGLETLGNSNSVSAGGYDIIRSHLKSQGITNVGMESSVEGKYLVLSKIILAEYMAMISKPDGVKNANVGEVIRIMKEVCEYSQAAKPNYRNQYMKLARDLKKFVEALMGQGFVPTRSKDKDLKEIKSIYGQIALVQGLGDTVLLKLPKSAMFTLARDVLLRSMDTWNSEKEVFPFAWTKNYSFSDVIICRTEGFAESGNFERARFDSNNLYPLWKTLTRDVWDDNKLKTNMLFDHLSKAGLIWPPRGKESGRPTVSAPSGKPACEVWVKGNQMSVSFRDGLAASSKIDGSRACDFLKYNGIKSQWPRNNLNAGKYNESIVKKLETKFKSAKGGFKLHGDSSADIVIEESRSKVTVSFSDHTWLPIALNLEPSADVKKDMAFVDEIQDLSVAKGSLIRKLIRNDGDSGLVLVGDGRQSIMQFSGSSATSMTDNAAASNCVSYPMTICWRGSHEVAHSANRVMQNVLEEVQGLWPQTDFPDYLSHKSPSIETWPVGKPMKSVGTDKLVPMVKELQEENPDVEIAVLSRVNQPLGAVILDLVTNGIGITTPSGKDGIVNSIKPILTNKYVEPKSASQGIGIDMDNTNFKDLRSVRNRLEQVTAWAYNQSVTRNKGDADAAAKDEKFVTIEGNASLAEALIELWFREGVPSSTKHKDFVDWFNNVLLSSSGNPVHVSSVHRFKGGECDYAFILRSAKGKPDKETGECMPREIFMNKSMNDAPENAIAEACIMYVAMTRSKVQNVQLWWEKSGEEEVVIDPTRCVECNALTNPDDHAVCIECNGLLCNEYRPLRGPQGGLLHKGGEFDTTLSCGEFLPRNADDFFDFTSTERSERNKHERYCDSCWENAPRDSAIYSRNDMYIARAMKEMEHLEGFFECLKEEHDLINADLSNEPLTHDDTTIVMMLEHISKMQMNLIDAMHYARDSNDIRHELEQAGILPANGATRVCANCDKQAVFDVDTAIGTRSFCSEKCYAEYNGLEVMEDPNFYGMMLITRKPIETVYEVHLWTREIEGKKLGEFDEFFKFKNEDSARKLYNQITDYTYKILMQYDGDEGDVLLEYDNHDPHENMGHRDSADFCNTCDAHIDLQGRDMLPRGMCIDCFIAQCREEMGVPNPIVVTDNWPENDSDEEPRDSSEFVTITLEEMDNFLVDAQGFRRLNPDEVGHSSGEWVYEYYLDMKPERRIRKYKDCRIRIYSSIPVSYKWHEINESTDVESLSDPINADKTFINPKYPDWVRTFDTTKSRGKGKDAIRCILLSGKADGSFSYAYHSKAGRCYRKATPTKRITNWRLNLLKKYEQWIWEEKI